VKGSALQPTVERDYSLDAWGPYTHLEATLAQPIYTFGRVKAGKAAAAGRVEVEKAQLRITRAEVALETRRMYYTHLYALSMLPSLKNAVKAVDGGLEQAQEMYDSGKGDVTLPDVMKMAYGLGEVRRFTRIAEDGARLALAALKHTMGMPAGEELVLDAKRLPKAGKAQPEELAVVLLRASKQRPEWDQLGEGKKAALSLEQSEKLANLPVIALAGTITHAWTPTRDDSENPYHVDPYNDFFGGVALAAQWEFDPGKASAKARAARALGKKVESLRRFAESGIPLQVKKAHMEVAQNLDLAKLASKSVKVTRKWMAFAGAAYKTNTGEAKDMLEGLVAHLQAKKAYYEHLRDYHVALAELRFATGDDAGVPADKDK